MGNLDGRIEVDAGTSQPRQGGAKDGPIGQNTATTPKAGKVGESNKDAASDVVSRTGSSQGDRPA